MPHAFERRSKREENSSRHTHVWCTRSIYRDAAGCDLEPIQWILYVEMSHSLWLWHWLERRVSALSTILFAFDNTHEREKCYIWISAITVCFLRLSISFFLSGAHLWNTMIFECQLNFCWCARLLNLLSAVNGIGTFLPHWWWLCFYHC